MKTRLALTLVLLTAASADAAHETSFERWQQAHETAERHLERARAERLEQEVKMICRNQEREYSDSKRREADRRGDSRARADGT